MSTKLKTNEDWIQEVYSMVGEEYTFLDPYVNNRTHLRVRHNKCGKIYKTTPNSFSGGVGRCNCTRGVIYNHEDFIRESHRGRDMTDYEVVGEYIDNKTNIKILHKTCNRVYKTSPSTFVNGHNCPLCYGVKAKRLKKEIEYHEILEGEGYTAIDPYVNTNTEVLIKHNICGRVYGVKPYNIFRGGGRCATCKKTANIKAFKKLLKESPEYEATSGFKGWSKSIKMRHLTCGREYNSTPSSLRDGKVCPYCINRKSPEDFKREFYEVSDGTYILHSEYVIGTQNIDIEHKRCGTIYSVRAKKFLEGIRCPKCNESKGESSVSSWLDRNSIYYVPQKSYKGLSVEKPLRYDFYLPEYNILIEYDGEQHFMPIEHFGGESRFREIQRNDSLKNEYANNNGIRLLRIPYWDFDNIEDILEKEVGSNAL